MLNGSYNLNGRSCMDERKQLERERERGRSEEICHEAVEVNDSADW